MQLRTLTGLERQEIENELAELRKLISALEAILADELKIIAIVREELLEMKQKYGDERRTKIISQELGKFSDEELIPEEDVVVVLTNENYIKRTKASEYRRQHRGGKGKRGMTTKEEDVIAHLVSASTHDWLLFFTNKGRVFRLKTHEVPTAGLNAKGVAIVNLLQLQPEENVTAIIRSEKRGQEGGYLFMTTVQGTVKKTPFEDYANIRTSGLIAIRLDDKDELRWIHHTTGEDDVIISTHLGQAIRFNEKDARAMGRTARGVRGIRLRADDRVVGMDVVKRNMQLLVISENGYGKRTNAHNFPTHRRGGVGVKAAAVTNKTGSIISVKSIIEENQELLIISMHGQTIRVGVADIPALGRTTQGVRIMRLGGDDHVASFALISKAVDSEEEERATDSKEVRSEVS
jgi:DNA gyrase subunit A